MIITTGHTDRPYRCRLVWPSLLLVAQLVAPTAFAAEDPFPKAAKSYLVRIDGTSVWAHQPNLRLPPASLTKMMTALLVLETRQPDEVVTVSKEAAAETGSRIGLKNGDRLRVADLLAATLLHSANDACHALADHVGGNQARFVAMMNRRARELDLRDTRFSNACGHDQAGLYSTASDLARLADVAMQHHPFAELVAMVRLQISTVDGRRKFKLENKNELIGRYPGAIGIKTGTTGKAGKCLIALAERDDKKVMLVMMNARERWWRAVEMLDLAFARQQPEGILPQP